MSDAMDFPESKFVIAAITCADAFLVRLAIMGFEMSFQKTQAVNPRAAAFADAGTPLGLADGDFLKHGCDQ
jgi:hypothetical protein